MPEYVYDSQKEEKEYEIKPSQLKRVAGYDSKLLYINNLNYAQMMRDSQTDISMPDTNYTTNPDEIEDEQEIHNLESNQQMQEAVAAAQQDAADELDEALDAIATSKFNALIANDKKQAETYLNSVKEAHKEDYDEYIGDLRKTNYYKKCLEKWKKYYTEIKDKCVESAKQEIEAHAKSDASEVAEKTHAKFDSKDFETKDIQVRKYVPKHISTNMVVDKHLKNTIQEILIDKLYDSLDESSDMYKKLASKNNPDNEDAKTHITDFRSSLSNMLQQSHNKLYPKRSGVYGPAYRDMQKNVANHAGKMTVSSASDLLILKMKDEIIPELAETLTLRLQEVLLTNKVSSFNITKEAAKELIEKLTDKAKLYDTVTEANQAVNGKLEIAEMLMAERKAMADTIKNGQEFDYNPEIFEYMRDKLEENRQNNTGKMNQTDYVRLENAIDNVEDFEKKVASKMQIDAQDKTTMKATYEDVKKLKELAKVEEKLNEDTSKKLFGKNDGIQLIFDYLVADYIESASNAEIRGSLSSFDYSKDDVKADIQRTREFLDKNNTLNPVITVEALDQCTVSLQDSRNKLAKDDVATFNKLTKVIDRAADMAIELENDEILQETGRPTEKDMQVIEEHQVEAMDILNNAIGYLNNDKKLKNLLSKEEVKDFKMGE